MKYWNGLPVVACLVTAVLVCGCASTPSSLVPSSLAVATTSATSPHSTGSGIFALQVESLSQGFVLPDPYTCKGASISPKVSWEKIPEGTKSLVLIVDDPDAPKGTFTHWILYNIPPSTRQIDRDQPYAKMLKNGAQQGDNSAGSRGYYPPCPPVGTAHHYVFSLYALDCELPLLTANRESIDSAMNGHVIGQETFTTMFKR